MKRLVLAALVVVAGCAHQHASSTAPQKPIQMDGVVFQAHPDGHVDTVDADSLFKQAGEDYAAKRFAEAAAGFDRIANDFDQSPIAVPALYNAGLSLEATGDLAAAAARYRKITAEHALGPSGAAGGAARSGTDDGAVLDAWFRLAKVQADAKQYADSAATWSEILARKDLGLADRVEAMARCGLMHFELHELYAAEHLFREQQAYYKAHESEERLDSDFFLGMGAYYLGEVAHEQYRALPLRLPERQLARDLDAKARMVLTAQQRFIDAMRVQNPEWATAAGFQIGSLYREFYDDMVNAPVPPALAGEAREIYLDEVRKQVRSLLQKAIAVHEKNLLMAERLGERNQWVQRSNEQMEQLRKLLTPGPMPAAAPADSTPAPPLPVPRPRDEVKPRVLM